MSKLSKRLPADYAELLTEVKERVRSAQYEALKAVNKQLVALYWDIGKVIAERQNREGWVNPLSSDWPVTFKMNFPELKDFRSKIYGICGSFTWNIMTTRNSNHWLEKLAGARIWLLWRVAKTLWSVNSTYA
jgi:hypothetical protein